MDAEKCFKELGRYLAHIQQSVITAPLSPEERGKLASLVTAFFYSTAVDVCLSPKPNSTPEDLDNVIEQLTALMNGTVRKSRSTIILNG